MWNEQKRLSKKFEPYHTLNHSFRTTTKDLQMIKNQQLYEQFRDSASKAQKNLSETYDRNQQRQLERKLLQYKSND